MPSWQSTSRIGCLINNPARRARGATPSTRPQWTRVPLDFHPRWRYVVNKAGAANAAPALKYKFYFTPHFCGYTEFGIVPHASLLAYAGINASALASHLGHSTMQTTMNTYIHAIRSVEDESADIMQTLLHKTDDQKPAS